MNTIAKIVKRLRERPELTYRVEGDAITVEPPTPEGFSVWLTEGDGEWIVGYAGWHEHFESEEAALDCFAYGLSGGCRLKIVYRGNVTCSWTLQYPRGDGWGDESRTGLLLFPFWRRRRVEYRRNAVERSG